MSYVHLTIHQRIKIETLHAEGLSTRQNASRIHVRHATVARDLKWVTSSHDYTTQEAQRDYEPKGHHKGRRSKVTPATHSGSFATNVVSRTNCRMRNILRNLF